MLGAPSQPDRQFPVSEGSPTSPVNLQAMGQLARRIAQDPRVAYLLASVKKALHHGGDRPLSPENEKALLQQITEQLMSNPDVLAAVQSAMSVQQLQAQG